MDFASLHSVVNDVRRRNGVDRKPSSPIHKPDPLRSRHATFRWRVIPAIYCMFYSAIVFYGRAYLLFSDSTFAGSYEWLVADYLISIFLGIAAIAWMRNRWIVAIGFMVGAFATQPLIVY